MSDTILFQSGAHGLTINKPGYGYEVELHFPIVSNVNSDGTRTYFISDTSPYPVLKPARWMLPQDQALSLATFLRSYSRGADIQMIFGVDGTGNALHSGFFPGGPLLGDCSAIDPSTLIEQYFTGRLLSQAPSAVLQKPMRWLQNELSFVINGAPTGIYVAGAMVPQGKLEIDIVVSGGTPTVLEGLPPPDGDCVISPVYKTQTVYSRTGAASSVSGLPAADAFVSKINLTLRTANAAALIDALSTAIAAVTDYSDVELIVYDPGYGIFGADIGISGIYTCQFIGSSDKAGSEIVLNLKHVSWDRWTVSMCLLLTGIVTE